MLKAISSAPLSGRQSAWKLILIALATILSGVILYSFLQLRHQMQGVMTLELGNIYTDVGRPDSSLPLQKLRQMADNRKQDEFWVMWNRIEESESVPKSLYWNRSSGRLVYTEKHYTDWGSRALRYAYSGVTMRHLDRLQNENTDPRLLKTLGCPEHMEMRERGKPGHLQ